MYSSSNLEIINYVDLTMRKYVHQISKILLFFKFVLLIKGIFSTFKRLFIFKDKKIRLGE